jgi:hypothetical protein
MIGWGKDKGERKKEKGFRRKAHGGRIKEKGFRRKAHGARWKDKGFLKWEVGPVVVRWSGTMPRLKMRKSERKKEGRG